MSLDRALITIIWCCTIIAGGILAVVLLRLMILGPCS